MRNLCVLLYLEYLFFYKKIFIFYLENTVKRRDTAYDICVFRYDICTRSYFCKQALEKNYICKRHLVQCIVVAKETYILNISFNSFL